MRESNYILHESVMESIYIEDSSLLICFSKGLYYKKNNQILLSNKRIMKIAITNLRRDHEYEHINIKITKKNGKIGEISLLDFSDLIQRFKVKVYLDLYANYFNVLLIKGNIGKMEAEFETTISEVEHISFLSKK